MEEFAHLSRESFERDQVFQGLEGKQYHTVSIDATPEGATSYATDCLQSDELAAFFDPQRHNLHRGDNASLRLVVIANPIHDGSGPAAPILMPKDTFLRLVDFAKVDPAALWLLLNQYDGLHYFPSATTETYYLGVSELALIWTFNASSLRTSAIAIRRRSTEGVQWIWFSQLFERHQKYIHTPMLLAYVLGLSLCCAYDHQIMWRQSRELVTIEKDVGYGKDSLKLENRVDVTTLAFAIQNIGGVLNHIANKQRHFAMIESILKAIESFTANPNESTKKYRDEIGDSNGKLIATFPSLRLRMQSSREYLAYLKERSERLSTVLYALMTHEDASVNTELAESSRQIAEASKRDSSSMKTVAIMTMAFLPGTFIAALFAVPSLDWDGDNVITNNFWIYWAFALPATIIVFMLWLLLDNRTAILSKVGHKKLTEKHW